MIKRDNKGKFIKGNLGYWTGKHRDKDTQEKMKKTQFIKGQTAWNKNLKGTHFSPETEFNGELKYWLGKTFSDGHKEKLSESHRGERHSNWQGGISKEPYPFNFDRELKELIRRRDGYKCQLCGMPEIENIRKLAIHHIDYNKKNCSPENLVALCGKCNPKVNFNRDYWTKYFQDKQGGKNV